MDSIEDLVDREIRLLEESEKKRQMNLAKDNPRGKTVERNTNFSSS